jgi:predicted phage tail component-like protein
MLSIDGVHLENDLGLHLLAGSDETMMPETRQDTLTIPDRHGAIVFDSYLEPRRLFPQILIPSQATLNDVQGIVRKVSSLLVDEYGNPKDVKLIYDYEPDKYYIARLTGYISVDRIAKAGIFLIPMYAYDPYAYAGMTAYDPTNSQVYNTGLQFDSGLMYPNGTSFLWAYNKHYSGVYNYSYYITPLRVVIEGEVINPKITNQITGKTMSIGIQLKAGEKLYIDGQNLTVIHEVNGIRSNSITNLQGDFIGLISGDNPLLFEGGLPNATVTFNWEHKFL